MTDFWIVAAMLPIFAAASGVLFVVLKLAAGPLIDAPDETSRKPQP